MNWTRLRNRLLGTPRTHEEDLDEELAFHREMKVRDLRDAGLSADEAGITASRSMGNLTIAREDAREAWTIVWLRDLLRDLRFGMRSLAAQPAFTLAAVVALVIGIGVNTITFQIYNALALAPWAIRDPGNTVHIFAGRVGPHGESEWHGVSWPHYRDLQNAESMAGIAAYATTGVRITRGEAAWAGMAIAVSGNFFDVLGTGFEAGRGFSQSNQIRDLIPEVVLHYDTWMNRFGGDRNVVGQWIDVNGSSLQVVGIAPRGFSGPSPSAPELWIPGPWRDKFHNVDSFDNPNACCVSLLGRLKPGVAREAAQAELSTRSARFLESVKRKKGGILLTRPTLLADPQIAGPATGVFLVVQVACFLILLLACANVANLQLARALARRREISVRLSLGASPGRVIRQLVAEGLILSVLASSLSLLLCGPIRTIVMQAVAQGENISLRFDNDWRVLLFVVLITFAAALLFGLLPAWGAVRDTVATGLREGGRVTATRRMRGVLLGAQVALCMVLLSGATLLLRALEEAKRMELGFQYGDVIQMSPGLDSIAGKDVEARALLATLVERVAKLASVEAVAHTNIVPLGNSFESVGLKDPSNARGYVSVGVSRVSANFFDVLRIPLVTGRAFRPADEAAGKAIIVTQEFAQQIWPGENPLGKRIKEAGDGEVVGVVRNFVIRDIGPLREKNLFLASSGVRGTRLLIRHNGSPDALVALLPKLARGIDKRFLATAAPYEENVAKARLAARLSASIAGGLSALALLLACVGIYGVATYNVAQRSREIGIRMALGAESSSILAMTLKQNLRVVFLGAVIGITGAIAAGQLLGSILYGVKPADPVALLSAIGILTVTALCSALAPARRASATDPVITLRHE